MKKQTAMQELKRKLQVVIGEMNGELSSYESGYKQCLINIQNDIDLQMMAMEKEQIIKAVNQHYVIPENYYYKTYHSVESNEMIDHIGDANKMVEDDAAPIDWLINQLENHIVLSAHGKLGTNRTGDYRIGLRKAIDFCHQAKEMEAKETLYTEEQVREVVKMAQTRKYNSHFYNADEIIKSLKQPKQ